MTWQPIPTAPIKPFDAERWYMPHSPRLLLLVRGYVDIDSYSYTRNGKGRWQDYHGRNCEPTHWSPLPDPPEQQP